MMRLTDQSQMPFGKYHGVVMEKVPASYLLWLWDEAGLWNRRAVEHEGQKGGLHSQNKQHTEKRLAVHDYIKENFSALETECKDRIIQHRP